MLAPNPSQHLESENPRRGNPYLRFSLPESCSRARSTLRWIATAPGRAASISSPRRFMLNLIPEQGEAVVTVQYFEDLEVGRKFASSTLTVDAAAIKAFAAAFDPQPFHLDEAAARGSVFEGLAASGWHTAALTMRLCVTGEFRPAGGILGAGGELNWLKPVRPGDELRIEVEILELRSSRSRPRHGIVKIRLTTMNQQGDAVQTFLPTLLVERRPEPR
jgi:acyl dehydratase